MLDCFPVEILNQVADNLDCKDTYNLSLVQRELNKQFNTEYLKNRFHYLVFQKLINTDFARFKKNIFTLKREDLNKIFNYSIQNIDTVWMNYEQGFLNMKYILECMIIGCRINDSLLQSLNFTGRYFNKYFYSDIVKAIGSFDHNDREKIQKNIDNTGMLRSLHSNFIPFNKKLIKRS